MGPNATNKRNLGARAAASSPSNRKKEPNLNKANAALTVQGRPQAPVDFSMPREFRSYYQWLDSQDKVPGVHDRMDKMFGEELEIAGRIKAEGPLVTSEEAANAVVSIERVDENGNTKLQSRTVEMHIQLGKRKIDDVEDDDQEQDAASSEDVEDMWRGPNSQDEKGDYGEDPTDRDYRPSVPRKSSTKRKSGIGVSKRRRKA